MSNKFLLILLIIFSFISLSLPISYSESNQIIKAYYFYEKQSNHRLTGDTWFYVQNLRTETLVIVYYEKNGEKFSIIKGYRELLDAITEKAENDPVRVAEPPHIDVVIISEKTRNSAAGCRGRVLVYPDGSWIEVSNGLVIRGVVQTREGYTIYFRLAYMEVLGPSFSSSELPCGARFFSNTIRGMLLTLTLGMILLAVRSVVSFRIDKLLNPWFTEEPSDYY